MKPTILSAPHPRSLELIFTAKRLAQLRESYAVIEVSEDKISNLSPQVLAQVHYIIGQPPLDHLLLEQLKQLKCIFNVESNLMDNMPYDTLFERGIHVVPGAIFAQPVAELLLPCADLGDKLLYIKPLRTASKNGARGHPPQSCCSTTGLA